MARYDHTDPKMGTFRCAIAADTNVGDIEKLFGVGHDANGRLVIGAGQTGVVAVWVATKIFRAGKRVDPMTSGQIVEFGPTAGQPGVDFGRAGTVYYSDTSGNIVAGVSEVQTITITTPTSVSTVTYGSTPINLPANATRAQVQAAFDTALGAGNTIIGGTGPFTVTFAGDLEGENIAQLAGTTNATVATTTPGGTNTGFVRVGHTAERGDRLIVRVRP